MTQLGVMPVSIAEARAGFKCPIDVPCEEVDTSVLRHHPDISVVSNRISKEIGESRHGGVVLGGIGFITTVAELSVVPAILVTEQRRTRPGSRHEGNVPVDLDVDVPLEPDGIHAIAIAPGAKSTVTELAVIVSPVARLEVEAITSLRSCRKFTRTNRDVPAVAAVRFVSTMTDLRERTVVVTRVVARSSHVVDRSDEADPPSCRYIDFTGVAVA